MKQKYKVFINDQEIVFQSARNEKNSSYTLLSSELSPIEMYRYVCDHPLSAKSLYVVQSSNPEKDFREFLKEFKIIEAAGGIVRKLGDSNEFLMIFRLGKWDLPKGKIDSGESPEEAALREVEEECGISGLTIGSKVTTSFHMYEQRNKIIVKLTHWYFMSTSDMRIPVPQTNEGIEEVRWVKKSELPLLLPESYSSINSLIREYVLNS